MSEQPPTVYGYTRISTNEDVQENSLDTQKDKIVDYVRYKFGGKEIVCGDIFHEQCSGSVPIFRRPEGKKLGGILRAGDHLVTAKLDRMFRDTVDAVVTVEELNMRNVHMHFLDMEIDTTSALGMAFLTISATFADLERKKIGERTKDTMQRLMREGRPVNNKMPYGWDIHIIDGEKKFVADESEREIARWVVEAKDSKEATWKWIEEHLGRKGHRRKNGAAWDRHALRRAYLAYKEDYPLYRDEATRKAARLHFNNRRKVK